MLELPKILLLGDSIRMSYQLQVKELLKGRAEVLGPAENCQYSLYTLSSLDRWIAELGTPDIVHWNNGLHDCGHSPARRPEQIPLEMFLGNIGLLADRLLALTPNVIWASITPVHPDYPFSENSWSWRKQEVEQYDQAAREVMAKKAISMNDLRAIVAGSMDEFLGDDKLHLSSRGQEICARAVVEHVRTHL